MRGQVVEGHIFRQESALCPNGTTVFAEESEGGGERESATFLSDDSPMSICCLHSRLQTPRFSSLQTSMHVRCGLC